MKVIETSPTLYKNKETIKLCKGKAHKNMLTLEESMIYNIFINI